MFHSVRRSISGQVVYCYDTTGDAKLAPFTGSGAK